MSPAQVQMFGGDWTGQKLAMLQEYLSAYTRALKNQPFQLVYIDAFAGTGYREEKRREGKQLLLADLAGGEPQKFFDGSARIAVQIEPAFQKYVFVEQSAKRLKELVKLTDEFPGLAGRVELVKEDCNTYLQDICQSWNWRAQRAVLFLDPFGMQIDWGTVQAIASTKAIDVWILFPLGIAVNRLLRRDGKIPRSWRSRLDRIFGTPDWYDHFYREDVSHELFGKVRRKRKIGGFDSISKYYNDRLRSVFAQVAQNPRQLCNSRRNPLFLLCFAASNPRGAPIALRIAQHILKG